MTNSSKYFLFLIISVFVLAFSIHGVIRDSCLDIVSEKVKVEGKYLNRNRGYIIFKDCDGNDVLQSVDTREYINSIVGEEVIISLEKHTLCESKYNFNIDLFLFIISSLFIVLSCIFIFFNGVRLYESL